MEGPPGAGRKTRSEQESSEKLRITRAKGDARAALCVDKQGQRAARSDLLGSGAGWKGPGALRASLSCFILQYSDKEIIESSGQHSYSVL